MEVGTQVNGMAPHQHRCAAKPEIHPAGRETPAPGENPLMCRCGHPEVPQCCANHPTANPNYRKQKDPGAAQLGQFADELRDLKTRMENAEADNKELREQVARLTEAMGKIEKFVR